MGGSSAMRASPQTFSSPDRYRLAEDGTIEVLKGYSFVGMSKGNRDFLEDWSEKAKSYPIKTLPEAINESSKKTKKSVSELEAKYKDQLSQNQTFNTLAEQIGTLTGGVRTPANIGMFNQAVANLGGDRNYAASDLGTRLNFQVSDQQIVDDYNASRLNRLNIIAEDGAAQIAGIQSRLQAANQLLASLPAGDPRRTSAQVSIDQLASDLASVQGAVTKANDQIKNFKPITPDSTEGLREITSFREFVKLPEERASEQLRQIDPEAYETARGLGQQFRNLITQELPATTTPQTEQLRQTIEQEALNQLRLGSTLGAEERRGYEQAVRAAQTARGNIFGLGPAVQEAAQIGRAGEERKLARFGAAQQFLGSGETTGAAAARDLALDALTQQRLGAAAGFIAGGPSIANLAQARTAQQQAAMQNYVTASMAGPGGFAMAPSTAQNFYQTTSPEIPVALTGEFNKLYSSQAGYQADVYGSQVGAISRQPSGAAIFGEIAGGLSNLIRI